MSFLDVHFWGQSLGKQASMYVVKPDGPGPFPVLYLLHGLSDDHTIWLRRTGIERYAEGRGLMLVMPDGGRSFYANDPRDGGLAYEDHIVKDVVGYVDATFPTIARRRGRAVAGLSMGGYGAIMLSLRNPDVFSAASSHSGAFGVFDAIRKGRPDIEKLVSMFPRDKYDPFLLATRYARARKARAKRPGNLAIRIDCGTEDFLVQSDREYHAHLEKLGIPHEYHEFPGDHNWEYWDCHIQETLDFVQRHMASAKKRQ